MNDLNSSVTVDSSTKACIIGLGICLPRDRVTNAQLFSRISNFEKDKATASLKKKGTFVAGLQDAQVFDLWVKQMCGIESRPFAFKGEFQDGLVAEDMATIACKEALADAGVGVDEVDHLIVSTYSSSRIMPSPACTVAKNLAMGDIGVRTLNGACSGFLDALIDAKIKVEAGIYEKVLVVATENMSDKMNFSDPKSAVIFSDGAGACLVCRADGVKPGAPCFVLQGFASGNSYSEQVYMERKHDILFNDGPYVQRNAVRTMAKVSDKALAASSLSFGDVSCIIPHQANARIIIAFDQKIKKEIASQQKADSARQAEAVVEKYHTVNCIANLGNLSSATVPVALHGYLGNKGLAELKDEKRNGNLVFTSVGGGYTYSAMVAKFV